MRRSSDSNPGGKNGPERNRFPKDHEREDVGNHCLMVYADIRKVPSDWQSIELFTQPEIDMTVLKRQVEPGASPH